MKTKPNATFVVQHMKIMNRITRLLPAAFLLIHLNSHAQGLAEYTYDSIPGDPLKARIYTLANGLKVYLSAYDTEPRFQSMIAVKAGSKNDPSTHTGLAHYLEHMLFKGTDRYGTLDFSMEKPLLDSIENLYEKYGWLQDSASRAALYRQIDLTSGEAAKYSIANEFDKMMEGLGVTQVNAYTSVEQTVYINNVPSNRADAFFQVEAERFRNPVFRIFHTELEAVYEEKNRSLDNDGSKIFENLYAGLFPNHQYGTQTTIGTIEHLKNPSLKEIRKYFNTWYVPNNMVIALSGDFNPDSMIRIIDGRFGQMKAAEVPAFKVAKEKLIKVPVIKQVYGPDAESVTLGFRFDGASSPDADLLTVVDYILSNGQAGLLDINLNKQQKVLSSYSSVDIMKDYSVHMLGGKPREGQSLEDVQKMLLDQIMEIKLGNFADWIIPAVITNLRLEEEKAYESNYRRASAMLEAEISGVAYKDVVKRIERLSGINKIQVIEFVRKWYGDNYVVVYKRNGTDENIVKVAKPPITPVVTNREMQSDFVKRILNSESPRIQPKFIDFQSAITTGKTRYGVPVFMIRNQENSLFQLRYVFDVGLVHDKRWGVLFQYLNYLGYGSFNAGQLQEEFYKLGCSFSASAGEEELVVTLRGVGENFNQAIILLEGLMAGSIPDDKALENLINDIVKKRADAKLNKNELFSRLSSFARYGEQTPENWTMSETQLRDLTAKELTVMLRNLNGYVHRIDYFGPADSLSLMSIISKYHKVPRGLQKANPVKPFKEQETSDGKIFFAHYAMKQAEISFLSKGGTFNPELQAMVFLYNRYFGGGMSSIVFQTLRESKALAYSVNSRYSSPIRPDRSYFSTAYIGTQADKLSEALYGMNELLQDMPVSENSFRNAKDGVVQGIEAERINRMDIISLYHANRKLNLDRDIRKDIYNRIQSLTIDDIVKFQRDYIKGKKYRLAVIGDRDKIDFEALQKSGEVVEPTPETLFGY